MPRNSVALEPRPSRRHLDTRAAGSLLLEAAQVPEPRAAVFPACLLAQGQPGVSWSSRRLSTHVPTACGELPEGGRASSGSRVRGSRADSDRSKISPALHGGHWKEASLPRDREDCSPVWLCRCATALMRWHGPQMGRGCSVCTLGPAHASPRGGCAGPQRPLWPLSLHHLPATTFWLCLLPRRPGPVIMGSDPPGHHVDTPRMSRLTLQNSILEFKYIFFSQRYLNLCFQMLVSNVDFDILFREKNPEGSRTPTFLFRTFSGVLVLPESMRTVTEQDG